MEYLKLVHGTRRFARLCSYALRENTTGWPRKSPGWPRCGRTTAAEALFGIGVLAQPLLGERIAQDVGAAAQAQLVQRGGLVRLDGLHADAELGRDFLVALAPGDEAQ